MASNDNLEGFQDTGYFSRAWALVTQEKGWWKPVLLLGLASLVPIVGPLCALGYCVEWSRRIAWGSTAAPERHVHVGELLQSGWRAFLVVIAWSLVGGIVGAVLGKVPLLGGLLGFAWSVFSIFLGMLFMAAAVRATIYQSLKAGFRAHTIWEMGKRDPWGLVRVWAVKLVGGLVIVAAGVCIVLPSLFGALPFLLDIASSMGGYYYMTDYEISYFGLSLASYLLKDLGPAVLLAIVVAIVLGAALSLFIYAGIGLWMRQFDVASWGKDEDPLPETQLAAQARSELPERPVEATPAASAEPVAPAASESAAPAAAPEPAAPAPAEEAPVAHAPIPMPPVSEPAGEEADGEVAASEADADDPDGEEEPPVPGRDDDAAAGEVIEVETIAAAPAAPSEPEREGEPAAEEPSEAPSVDGGDVAE